MNNKFTIPGIAAVVALIIGFAAGYYVPHGAQNGFAGRGGTAMLTRGGTGGSFARGAGGTGGLLAGTVEKQSDGSFTLNTRDGSSHVVLVTSGTSVTKSVSGSASDVTNGVNVIVTGTQNSDGSISATNIQLRPAGAGTPGANAPMIPAK